MPEISRMFFRAHTPPHFHAFYGEHQALINVHTMAVISGKLPARAFGLVTEWALLHQDELLETWMKARKHEPLGKIEPLP